MGLLADPERLRAVAAHLLDARTRGAVQRLLGWNREHVVIVERIEPSEVLGSTEAVREEVMRRLMRTDPFGELSRLTQPALRQGGQLVRARGTDGRLPIR